MLRFKLPWKDVVKRLSEIRKDDDAFVENVKILTNRGKTRAIVIRLYTRYMIASNELSICHDYYIQPQIRILIKKMLMCVYGRILELKKILIDEDLSIYTSVITELHNMQLPYDYFELRVPRCFRDERRSFFNDMDSKIDAIHKRVIAENNCSSQIKVEIDEKEEQKSNQLISQGTEDIEFDFINLMPTDQQIPLKMREITNEDILRDLALKIIHKYIIVRQSCETVNEKLSAQRTREHIISGKYTMPTKEVSHKAAVQIQRFWRFYRIKRRTKVRTERKNILIGLIGSSSVGRPNISIMNDYYDIIRPKQNEADKELKKITKKLQEKFNRRNKHKVIDEIEYDLKSYIWTNFERLPSWPDSTPIMFTNNDILDLPPIILSKNALGSDIPDPQLMLLLQFRIPLGGAVNFDTGSLTIELAELIATLVVEFEKKPEKEQAEIIKKSIKNKQIEKEIENNITKLTQRGVKLENVPKLSEFTERFNESLNEFDNYWMKDYRPDDRPREDFITTAINKKFQVELKVIIDQIIQGELERLLTKLATELGEKKKSKKKKKKAKSKKKKKEPKIPNFEQIFEELVKNNMIKKSVTSEFHEFEGEVSYIPRQFNNPYSLGDVRQIIKEQIMLSLIFPELRTAYGIKPLSPLLIAGPNKSGKTLLINALCTETGSLKIELTPQNVSKNYQNNNEINQLTFKVTEFAKVYQPVVIEIDLADVPFYGKIPENLKQDNPILMIKVLSNFLKSIKKTERIIVIGKATKPWLSKGNKLTRVFPNIVFTVPDHNSMFLFLKSLLMRYPEVSRRFLIRPLLEMLSNYPRQKIVEIVAEILTNERLSQLKLIPLDPKEFISVVINYPSPYPKLHDQYNNWYNKYAPLGIKKRLQEETDQLNEQTKISK